VVAAVGDRASVVAGVGTNDTAHSIELARRAEAAGARPGCWSSPHSLPPQAGWPRTSPRWPTPPGCQSCCTTSRAGPAPRSRPRRCCRWPGTRGSSRSGRQGRPGRGLGRDGPHRAGLLLGRRHPQPALAVGWRVRVRQRARARGRRPAARHDRRLPGRERGQRAGPCTAACCRCTPG
jgi:hypothetical protein